MRSKISLVNNTILGILLSIVGYIAHAQPSQIEANIPHPVPKSPNVAAVDAYGNYEVDLFNGIPNISIPIFEAQSGGLKIPISLNYHASGIKPTDVASWVGMGWSLSTGGQVSRSIRGKADENSYLSQAITGSVSVCSNFTYLQGAYNVSTDTEPDTYSYSFPGKRGNFLRLYGASAPLLVPYAPVAVTWSTNEYDIRDENGVLYKFGTGSKGTAYESTTSSNTSGITAWHLMDMIAPNSDDQINLEYQSLGGQITTSDITNTLQVQDLCYLANGATTCPTQFPGLVTSTHYGTTSPVAVKYIFFEGGVVEFVLSEADREDQPAHNTKYLDYILIKDINGSVIKRIKFNYGYFTSTTTSYQSLKLNSVEFKDGAGSNVIQKYTFTYHTNSFSWDTSHANFAYARDLWGYYNGATGNTNLIIPQTVSSQASASSGSPSNYTIGGGTDRAVNTNYITEGVLQRIDFPTGGYTVFEFEANKYNDGSEKLAGGLRVKKIKSYECGSCTPITKAYKYGSGESGYGSPNFNMDEYKYNSTVKVYSDCEGVMPITNYQSRTYSSSTAYSLDPFDSSPMSYPYVREIFGDPGSSTGSARATPSSPDNTLNGYIDYIFDAGIAIGTTPTVIESSGKSWKDSYYWKRGHLTKKIVYDNSNNKLSETTTGWSQLQETTTVVGLGVHLFIAGNNSTICAGGTSCGPGDDRNNQTYKHNYFSQSSGVYLPTSVEEKVWENGSTTKVTTKTTTTAYHSSKIQPTTVTTTRVGSETSVTKNLYPFELSALSTNTGNVKGIYMLNNKNICTTPIETWTYISNGGTDKYVSGIVNTFKENPNNPNHVVPDKVYTLEPDGQGTTTSKSATTTNTGSNTFTPDGNYKSKVTFSSFDIDGNMLQVSRTGGLITSYQYGYDNTTPVAEVKNAENTLVVTQTTQNISVGLSASPGVTSASNSFPFTVDYTGDVILYLNVTASASASVTTSGPFILTNQPITSASCLTTIAYTASNMAPGNYNLSITVNGNNLGWTVCGRIVVPKNSMGGTKEILYDGLEDRSVGGGVTSNASEAHTGLKYFSGDLTIEFTKPNAKDYIIEYWYRSSGVWTYISKTYTGTSMLLNEGDAIDDVRIYPKDAQMKSYTYNTVNGMTSSIDENGLTFIYEYDDFGRLYRVKNDKGGIEKQYTYNYNNGN